MGIRRSGLEIVFGTAALTLGGEAIKKSGLFSLDETTNGALALPSAFLIMGALVIIFTAARQLDRELD